MIFGLSHVDIFVRELARAERFWVEGTGFSVRRRAEGFVDVDAGNALLRIAVVARPSGRAHVRLQSNDVEADARRLVDAGGTLLYEPMRTEALELVATVACPDGHSVYVCRELTEDEYGFVPELPTTAAWTPPAEVLLKGLLGHVPALFRGLARRKVTRNAEHLALHTGRGVVDEDTVVRAYILSNAKITRDRVRAPLLAHGYNPEDYPDELEA